MPSLTNQRHSRLNFSRSINLRSERPRRAVRDDGLASQACGEERDGKAPVPSPVQSSAPDAIAFCEDARQGGSSRRSTCHAPATKGGVIRRAFVCPQYALQARPACCYDRELACRGAAAYRIRYRQPVIHSLGRRPALHKPCANRWQFRAASILPLSEAPSDEPQSDWLLELPVQKLTWAAYRHDSNRRNCRDRNGPRKRGTPFKDSANSQLRLHT
jgi:hypothetical protein